MARKGGNPNWGKVMTGKFGVEQTAFEIKVTQLGLKPDEYVHSRDLRRWAAANRTKRFIPEELLDAWGLSVDVDAYGMAVWS